MNLKPPDIQGALFFWTPELDAKRSYQTGIPKAHYKFFYKSNFGTRDKEGKVISSPQREILLDIVFSENPYPVTVKRPIDTEWVLQEGDVIKTIMPDIDSIIGDKLTAFAPNTTGVPYGKEKEIMKQLFDIGCLFDEFINADEIARGISPLNPEKASIEAGRFMLTKIDKLIAGKKDFAFETTLATKSFTKS